MSHNNNLREYITESFVSKIIPAMILLIFIVIVLILIIVPDQPFRMVGAIVMLFVLIPVFFLNKAGKSKHAILIVLSAMGVNILVSMYLSGGANAPGFIGIISMTIVIYSVYGRKKTYFYIFAVALTGFVFVLLEQFGKIIIPPQPPQIFVLFVYGAWMVFTFLFISVPLDLMFDALNKSEVQRHRIEKAIEKQKAAEDELESIMNKTPDIIYRLDPDGKILYINKAVEKYGYSVADVIGRNILEFVPYEMRDSLENALRERRTGDRATKNIEIILHTKGGRQVDFEIHSSVHEEKVFLLYSEGIYSEGPEDKRVFLGTQGIARDITERKESDLHIQKLATVIDQAVEEVMITNPQGEIEYVNPKFEEVTGYSKEEVIGKNPRFLKSGKTPADTYSELWSTITSGNIWKGKLWNKTKNNEMILNDVTIKPIISPNNAITAYASVRRDITIQAQIEAQLQQSQKMEAIGTLAGGIAHDFNNILAAIIGFTELAIFHSGENPEISDMLENVLNASDRAKDLVRQILSFSRNQEYEAKPVMPKIIAKEVLKLMRASLPATIEIKQSLNSDSIIMADPTSIHQVLMNLCTNAGYAMKEKGGTLSVSLDDQEIDKDFSDKILEIPEGDCVKLSVADTGTGIPKDVQKKIFDPFFTTKPKDEGTGMGLSVVHGIVKYLGGTLKLKSEENIGTTIDIYLPVEKKVKKVVDDNSDSIPLIRGTESILFVDDEFAQINIALKSLGESGYRVSGFNSALSALDEYTMNREKYDLIITDMTMPGMTGDVFIESIRKLDKDIPIILCTGFSDKLYKVKDKGLGINAFLYKPISIVEMSRTVRQVLDEDMPLR